MADFDHNLSLADALTEPPPQIEEEVKRDFIATLEAEKFDDVVGETVGKTDYVPLLDDDDPKAGSQEMKTKPHADNVLVERKYLNTTVSDWCLQRVLFWWVEEPWDQQCKDSAVAKQIGKLGRTWH